MHLLSSATFTKLTEEVRKRTLLPSTATKQHCNIWCSILLWNNISGRNGKHTSRHIWRYCEAISRHLQVKKLSNNTLESKVLFKHTYSYLSTQHDTCMYDTKESSFLPLVLLRCSSKLPIQFYFKGEKESLEDDAKCFEFQHICIAGQAEKSCEYLACLWLLPNFPSLDIKFYGMDDTIWIAMQEFQCIFLIITSLAWLTLIENKTKIGSNYYPVSSFFLSDTTSQVYQHFFPLSSFIALVSQ